jgi:hypothetical protein
MMNRLYVSKEEEAQEEAKRGSQPGAEVWAEHKNKPSFIEATSRVAPLFPNAIFTTTTENMDQHQHAARAGAVGVGVVGVG